MSTDSSRVLIRMVDLTAEMAGLWTALGAAPAHRGRLVLFTSGRRGEGVSTISREFARLAAARARKPVWLVDADLAGQEQVRMMSAEPHRFGRAGEAVVGSPDGSSFFAVIPPLLNRERQPVRPARLLSAKPFLGRRLFVTNFHAEYLTASHKAVVLGQGDYWDALSRHSETVVIDAPSGDVALALAPYADAVVMVVREGLDVAEHLAFKSQLEAAGAQIKGIVLNRATYQPPKLLKKLVG